MKMTHYPFPSIEQFRNVIKKIKFNTQLIGDPDAGFLNESIPLPTINFVGTVKLHGTNAAIVWDNKQKIFYAQSRERVITPENDNGGFARFASTIAHDDLLFSLKKGDYETLKIYGEWCGGNIQGGVALAKLQKMFVIFAGQKDDRWLSIEEISAIKDPGHRIFNIYDYPTYEIEIDFNNPEASIPELEKLALMVEAECPFAKMFDVSGVGEGIVWRAEHSGYIYCFKVKGEQHKNIKETKLVQLAPDKAASLMDLVKNVTTEQRLQQGFDKIVEIHGFADRKYTGEFIGWVLADIEKENVDVVLAAGFTIKDINKDVSALARQWFFKLV